MNDELDLESLESITGGKKFLTREEEARVYQNFSGDNAKKMVDLLNQKKALEEIKQQETSQELSGGRKV